MPKKKVAKEKKGAVEEEVIEEPSEPVAEEPVASEPVEAKPAEAKSIEQIAAEAWDAVKGDDDASFAESANAHQRDLIYAAQSAARSGASKGDTSLAKFEQKVAELLAAQA